MRTNVISIRFLRFLGQALISLGFVILAVIFFSNVSSFGVGNAEAAEAPAVITYQGKVLVNGLAVTSTVSMIFAIYTDPGGGPAVYTASGTVMSPSAMSVTPVNGVFSVNLGGSGTNSLSPTLFQTYGPLYLQVTVEGEPLTPLKQLTAAPYAFNAKYLDGIAPSSTPLASAYIPVADSLGNFNFNNVTSTGLSVSGLSSLATTSISTALGVGTTTPQAGLHLYNKRLLVDNPISLSIVSTFATSSGDPVYGLHVSGKYAYAATQASGLEIIDISVPSSPTWVGTYNTAGSSNDVRVVGKYAYIADYSTGLVIVDISNPASPTLVGSYDTAGNAEHVYVSGRYAYIGDTVNGLEIIDISDPSNPILVGTYDTNGSSDVFISGKYAYIAGTGLEIIDISVPSNPTQIGSVGSSTVSGVYVSGKYAYVSDDGLRIYNISNPASPTLVGSYALGGSPSAVSVSGKYAYLVDQLVGAGGGLFVFDVSNPASPSLVSSYDTDGYAVDLYVSGKYVYVADSNSGMHIFDILGADIHAADVGSLSTNNFTVWEDTDIGNNLFVRNGLSVGSSFLASGFATLGETTIMGDLSVGTSNKTAALTVKASSTSAISFLVEDYDGNDLVSIASSTMPVWTNGSFENFAGAALTVGSQGGKPGGIIIEDGALRINENGIMGTQLVSGTFTLGSGTVTSTYRPDSILFGQSVLVPAGTFTVNSSGNISSSGTLRMHGVTTLDMTTVLGDLSVGTSDKLAALTVRASSTSAASLLVEDYGGDDLISVASSTISVWEEGSVGIYGGVAVLTVGSQGGKLGAVVLEEGILTVKEDGQIRAQLTSGSFVMGSGSVTSTYGATRILFGQSVFKPGGTFLLNESGDISSSGTLRAQQIMTRGEDGVDYFHVNPDGNISASGTMHLYNTFSAGNNAANPTFTLDYTGALSTSGTVSIYDKLGVGTSTPQSGLHVFNKEFLVDNPVNPTLTGSYNTSAGSLRLHISGKYAYVADGSSGLQIIDVTTPSSPSLAGSYDTSGNAYDVHVSGKYAYVADSGAGLQIIDVSTPTSTKLVGTYDTSDVAFGVYVSGKYAYVADGFSGLHIIDISNPAAPTLTGTYNTPNDARHVYVSGNYAYVADNTSGLQIIDISNPSAPALAGAYDTVGSARHIYISGKYAYVADLGSGLQIIDVSSPSAPTLVGTYDTSGSALGVHISGKYAYVADSGSGLQIIDVSTPSSPFLVGTYDSDGLSYGVQVSGKYAFIADDSAGLKIINVLGADIHAANIGNLASNNLTVWENIDVGNNLSIRNGLNIGSGGLYAHGAIASYVSSSASVDIPAAHFVLFDGNSTSTFGSVMVLDRRNMDGTILSLRQDGVEEGDITVSGNTVSYNAFTGSHYAVLPAGTTDMQKGTLLTLTGLNQRLHDNTNSEIIYGVDSTSLANDSGVIGSYLALKNPGEYSKANPYLVMAVGNGEMWVSDNGYNIQPGDFLISSDVSGHAMKDVNQFDQSNVVARAAEAINWAEVTETINGVKHARISVFYESFVKDNRLAKTFTIDNDSGSVTLGTVSSTFAFNISQSLRFTDSLLNNISFATSALFASDLTSASGNKAFVLNAANFAPVSDATLLTLQSGGVSQFVVRANGNVLTNGTVTAASFMTGTSTLDLAETYPVSTSCSNEGNCPVAGDAVCLVDGQVSSIEKCSLPYSQKAIGIVSTNPGFTLGGAGAENERKIALAGRVPLKVSSKNGAIRLGDALTTSETPGVAMKATEAGPTIGVALEDFHGDTGTMLVFVKMGWWSPLTIASPDVTTSNFSSAVIMETVLSGLRDLGISIVQGIVQATEFIAEKVTSGEVATQKLCVGDTCITKNQLQQLLEKNNIAPETNVVEEPAGDTAVVTEPVTETETASSTPDTSTTSTPPVSSDTTTTTSTEPVVESEEPAPAETEPVDSGTEQVVDEETTSTTEPTTTDQTETVEPVANDEPVVTEEPPVSEPEPVAEEESVPAPEPEPTPTSEVTE